MTEATGSAATSNAKENLASRQNKGAKAQNSAPADYGGDISDVWWAIGGCTAAAVAVVSYIAVFAEPGSRGSLILSSALGGMIGWVLGILATPYNVREAERLNAISKLAYAALSGYAVAKLDPLISTLLGSGAAAKPDVSLLSNFAVGLIVLLAAAILTYVTRSYTETQQQPRKLV